MAPTLCSASVVDQPDERLEEEVTCSSTSEIHADIHSGDLGQVLKLSCREI